MFRSFQLQGHVTASEDDLMQGARWSPRPGADEDRRRREFPFGNAVVRFPCAPRPAPADAVLLDLAVERPLADAEELGGLLAIAAGQLEGLGDVIAFDLLERAPDQVEAAAARLAADGG